MCKFETKRRNAYNLVFLSLHLHWYAIIRQEEGGKKGVTGLNHLATLQASNLPMMIMMMMMVMMMGMMMGMMMMMMVMVMVMVMMVIAAMMVHVSVVRAMVRVMTPLLMKC